MSALSSSRFEHSAGSSHSSWYGDDLVCKRATGWWLDLWKNEGPAARLLSSVAFVKVRCTLQHLTARLSMMQECRQPFEPSQRLRLASPRMSRNTPRRIRCWVSAQPRACRWCMKRPDMSLIESIYPDTDAMMPGMTHQVQDEKDWQAYDESRSSPKVSGPSRKSIVWMMRSEQVVLSDILVLIETCPESTDGKRTDPGA